MALLPPPTQATSKSGRRSFAFENLPARFHADDALKIAHHHRVGMRAERGAQYIMSGAHVRDPIAHRFVDRFLERGLSGGDRNDFRAEKFHARDVERLALHVDLAHVNDAFAAEARCDRGGGDAMLARAGFGDDALLAHSLARARIWPSALLILCAPV